MNGEPQVSIGTDHLSIVIVTRSPDKCIEFAVLQIHFHLPLLLPPPLGQYHTHSLPVICSTIARGRPGQVWRVHHPPYLYREHACTHARRASRTDFHSRPREPETIANPSVLSFEKTKWKSNDPSTSGNESFVEEIHDANSSQPPNLTTKPRSKAYLHST